MNYIITLENHLNKNIMQSVLILMELNCKNSKRIDNRAINMIVELLKKKIPVVFYYWSVVKLDLMI